MIVRSRMSIIAFLLAAFLVSLSGVAWGQEHGGATEAGQAEETPQQWKKQPSEQEAQEMMQKVMGPMMGGMMEQMVKSIAKAYAEPEVTQQLATFMRSYYEALIDRGFTPEEAMRIVTSSGLPSMGGKQ